MSRQKILMLLGGARSDTLCNLVSFVATKISAPLGQPLDEIGDKSMARHLNALIHGVNTLKTATPAALKASKGSPIKGEFMPWGFGDASRRGEWEKALQATMDLAKHRNWNFGKTLAHFQHLLHSSAPSNRLIPDLVDWLVHKHMSHELRRHLRLRVRPEWERGDLPPHWLTASWQGQGIDQETLQKETLHLSEGNQSLADEAITRLW